MNTKKEIENIISELTPKNKGERRLIKKVELQIELTHNDLQKWQIVRIWLLGKYINDKVTEKPANVEFILIVRTYIDEDLWSEESLHIHFYDINKEEIFPEDNNCIYSRYAKQEDVNLELYKAYTKFDHDDKISHIDFANLIE